LAAANIAPIARGIEDVLRGGGAKLTVFVGHDTNVASLGGLLGLHWQAPGFAADDPTPGGAIELDLLRDGKGRRFVRAFYRSQSLEQIRSLSETAPDRAPLAIGACGSLCPLDHFMKLLAPDR
jgi:4-phytase/acid phosphatase